METMLNNHPFTNEAGFDAAINRTIIDLPEVTLIYMRYLNFKIAALTARIEALEP